MTRLVVDVLQTPGIIQDTPAHRLKESAFSDGANIRFGDAGAEALPGDLETFSDASVTPLWLQFFPPITNPRWVYATLTEVWVFEGSSHTEITRASGDYNAIPSERWQSAVLNGIGIFNNTIDVPQAWTDFDPGTALVDLPNWTSTRRCKSIRAFKNYLVALYMTDSGTARPYRIVWSDSADVGTVPGSWDTTDPATDAREVDLAETSDYLVDQLVLGDVNIIYKEHSTWGMQFIGPPFYFRFWKILSKRGLIARDCMVNFPKGHIVWGQDDIVAHNGGIESAESILTRAWRTWLFQNIDPASFFNCFILPNPRKNEMYFCFPELGETYSTRALQWNYRDKSFGVRELTATPYAAIGPVGSSIDDDPEWGT